MLAAVGTYVPTVATIAASTRTRAVATSLKLPSSCLLAFTSGVTRKQILRCDGHGCQNHRHGGEPRARSIKVSWDGEARRETNALHDGSCYRLAHESQSRGGEPQAAVHNR